MRFVSVVACLVKLPWQGQIMPMKAETPHLKKAKMVASILNVVGGLLVQQERKIIKNEKRCRNGNSLLHASSSPTAVW